MSPMKCGRGLFALVVAVLSASAAGAQENLDPGKPAPKAVCRELRDLPSQRARACQGPLHPHALCVPAAALCEQFRLGLGTGVVSQLRRQREAGKTRAAAHAPRPAASNARTSLRPPCRCRDASAFYFDAFSSREPVPTSLENAPASTASSQPCCEITPARPSFRLRAGIGTDKGSRRRAGRRGHGSRASDQGREIRGEGRQMRRAGPGSDGKVPAEFLRGAGRLLPQPRRRFPQHHREAQG